MSADRSPAAALRQADIGQISTGVRATLRKILLPLTALIAIEAGAQAMGGERGLAGFALISTGALIALSTWANRGKGLPLLPLLVVQHLVAYSLPIATQNSSLEPYTGAQITASGVELLIFFLALTGGWSVGMQAISPGSPMCYALEGLDERSPKLMRLGVWMVVGSSAWILAGSLQMLDFVLRLLPAGAGSIITALLAAVSACGFFLMGIMVGRGQANGVTRLLFWTLLALRCYVAASAFLLSSTVTVVFSAAIGLFWGSGKVPWRFLLVVVLTLSFFNLGKFAMREKYWLKSEGSPIPSFALQDMPRYYSEWFDDSLAALTGAEKERNAWDASTVDDEEVHTGQTIFDRVNNLHNLLFVIGATENSRREWLSGATYTLIPPLLVPRVLWPDKPRSHQGQIMLNVHFGRQDLASTHHTYIAWGLIPEAYGNFGPYTGTLILGAVLGLLFAWIEQGTRRKLLLSTEGFLAFTVFLGVAYSYEMVASVMVTSIFQACIPVLIATAPFVRRQMPKAMAVPPQAPAP